MLPQENRSHNIAPISGGAALTTLRRKEPQTASRYRCGGLLPQDRSTGNYPALTMLTAHCAHTLTALTARSLRCDHSGPQAAWCHSGRSLPQDRCRNCHPAAVICLLRSLRSLRPVTCLQSCGEKLPQDDRSKNSHQRPSAINRPYIFLGLYGIPHISAHFRTYSLGSRLVS